FLDRLQGELACLGGNRGRIARLQPLTPGVGAAGNRYADRSGKLLVGKLPNAVPHREHLVEVRRPLDVMGREERCARAKKKVLQPVVCLARWVKLAEINNVFHLDRHVRGNNDPGALEEVSAEDGSREGAQRASGGRVAQQVGEGKTLRL